MESGRNIMLSCCVSGFWSGIMGLNRGRMSQGEGYRSFEYIKRSRAF